ncbi:sigma factor algU negative regulatory protein AlgS [Alcanivorax hongdengensis A-11-3]|uniref:Sigma factor algU negative regulatory protein AlgS n=1 Tax=Alcanivorax hongdengensis A-11-3 TaxID=1177179 RepID=L0WB16_9GAMM|nr:sigma-E factor negative regulatory protein [Alcanivorax hongdengensis]EKF73943.1 sigma factor algU negative regulatory protein AlgS [Alcanivorax hongdengensis A-11-3]
MKNRDFEALSAFLDGETSELESRRVMRDMDEDGLDAVSRWQLASDLMRGQPSMAVPAGFNAGLSAALAEESQPARRPAWVGGMARVAVAASVAAATVIGWQAWDSGNGSLAEGKPAAVMASADNRLSRPFGEASLVSQSFNGNAAVATPATVRVDQPRVNAMLLRHSEFSARHSGQGMMPFARLVSLDARRGAE